jgi:SAM-dependent methyltransferase
LSNGPNRLHSGMSATLPDHLEYYERYWQPNDTWGPSGGGVDPLERGLIKPLARAGTVCLDYGCGDGRRYGTWLQELDVRYHGFDISQAAVQVAGTLGLNVALLTPDGHTTLADDCCDLAICFEVFEHLQEPQFAIQEIRRVLKPNGVLLASVPNAADWFRRLEFLLTGFFNPGGSPLTSRKMPWNDPHIRFFSPRLFRRFLRENGFAEIELIPNQFSLSALPYIYRNPTLSGFFGKISKPFGRLSELSPGLFATRLFARALKG